MEKEDILMLAQLLHTMKGLADKLEEDFNTKNAESLRKTKLEMLRIQKKIKEGI